MPLQTSGPISLANIAAEFGGTAPHSLSEYYRGGGLVPNAAANNAIPTGGAISLNQFYGAANLILDVTVALTVSDTGGGGQPIRRGYVRNVQGAVNPNPISFGAALLDRYTVDLYPDGSGNDQFVLLTSSPMPSNIQFCSIRSAGGVLIRGLSRQNSASNQYTLGVEAGSGGIFNGTYRIVFS
jgi:hypothetical protein